MNQSGLLRAALRPLCAALLFLWSTQASAQTSSASPAYVEALIARAHTLHLAENAQWLHMGYWHKNPLTGYESDAKGPDYFLAKGWAWPILKRR